MGPVRSAALFMAVPVLVAAPVFVILHWLRMTWYSDLHKAARLAEPFGELVCEAHQREQPERWHRGHDRAGEIFRRQQRLEPEVRMPA